MKQSVYLETSLISYLAARPSGDLIVAGHQQNSQEWWDLRQDWDLSIPEELLGERYVDCPDRRRVTLTPGGTRRLLQQ